MIDLDRAERAVSSMTSTAPIGYQSSTLHAHNLARTVYLPLFPTIIFGPNNHLLLANVPGSLLLSLARADPSSSLSSHAA